MISVVFLLSVSSSNIGLHVTECYVDRFAVAFVGYNQHCKFFLLLASLAATNRRSTDIDGNRPKARETGWRQKASERPSERERENREDKREVIIYSGIYLEVKTNLSI